VKTRNFLSLMAMVLMFTQLSCLPVLAACGNFILKWGSNGTGNGQFTSSYYLATDSSNNIYIADTGNHRVEKFDSSGNYITQWGSAGSANGQFSSLSSPFGIAVDSSNNILVIDTGNYRIQKFDSNGNFLNKFGSFGTGVGGLGTPYGIAIDPINNSIYVTDNYNNKVLKYDSSGNFLFQWGSAGAGNGQFAGIRGIAVDAAGNVYTTEITNNRVQKFTSAGTYITQWGTTGTGNGQLKSPYGITVDAAGYIYVTDNGNQRVQKFNSSANYITQWGVIGSSNGQFIGPMGIVIVTQGYIYVLDSGNNRVEKFSCTNTCTYPQATLLAMRTITAGSTKVSASDFTTLMSNVNALRTDAGLATCGWTQGTAPAAGTGRKVLATDINDIRACLAQVYTTCTGSCTSAAPGYCSSFNVAACGVSNTPSTSCPVGTPPTKIYATDIQNLITGINNAP